MRGDTPSREHTRVGEDEGATADRHDATNSCPASADPFGGARVELRFTEVHSARNHERVDGPANLAQPVDPKPHAARGVGVRDWAREAEAIRRLLAPTAPALVCSHEDVRRAGQIEQLAPGKDQEDEVSGHAREYGTK
jgi:hypothetical protein